MRNILITGGTGQIGKILTRKILDEGNAVTLFTRNEVDAKKRMNLQDEVEDRVTFIGVDLYDETAVRKKITKLKSNIDTVIFAARSLENLRINPDGSVPSESFQMEMYLALISPYSIIIEMTKTHPIKDIIFISSMYGSVAPTPGLYEDFSHESPINYGVGKAAQIHLTKELAVRLADKNIRVNCISYGGLEGRQSIDFVKKYAKLNPIGRMLNEQDLYPPVGYILNHPELAITGENIKVDGGWTIW